MAFVGKNLKINTSTFTPQSAQPANPVEGMVYYDDGTTNTEGLYKYQNAVWEFIGTLVDHLKLNPLAADPLTPVEGQLYYSDGTVRAKGLWEYKDGDWQPVGSQGGSLDIIYQEDFETDMKAANLTSGNNASFDGGGTLDGALSDETVNQLNGRNSIKYVAGAASANDFFHTGSIALSKKSRGNFISFSTHVKFSGAVDTMKLVLFNDTTSKVVESVSVNSAESKPYSLLYYVPATTTALKYGFQAQAGIANTDELIFDDFQVELNPFIDVLETGNTVFTARLQNNGTASVKAQSGNFIQSVNRSALGQIDITFVPGFFTEIPHVVASQEDNVLPSVANASDVKVYNVTTSGCSVSTEASTTGAQIDDDVNIIAQYGPTDFDNQITKGVLVKNSAAQNSMVRLCTANGKGLTNTFIRRFSTILSNTGSAVDYQDSATLGASFTIKEDGIYHITYDDNYSAGGQTFGVSLNSTQLSTNIASITPADILTNGRTPGAGFQTGTSSWAGELKVGDVVRPHTGTGTTGTADLAKFTISKIGVSQLTGIPFPKTVYISDEKTSGTDGGTFTSGSRQTRDLNTSSSNLIQIVGNQMIVPAGKWKADFVIPARQVLAHKAFLRDTDNSIDLIIGTSGYEGVGNTVSNSFIKGEFTLTETTTLEIQHICGSTKTINGYGIAGGFGTEIYTNGSLTKVE